MSKHVWVCIVMMKDVHLDEPDEYLEEGRARSKDEHSCCTVMLFRTPPEQEMAGWKPQKTAFSGSPTLMIS